MNWSEAIDAVLRLGSDSTAPVCVVLDEFGYLLAQNPSIPSSLQNALSPRGRARLSSRTRLILCGSALATMRSLFGGSAPLRGRATTELMVHPFDPSRRRSAKRTTFTLAEPILRLHQLVIRPHEARLIARRGARVWAEVADTVSSRIYGPHLEHLARRWTLLHASPDTLGGVPGRVQPTVLHCPDPACPAPGHEIDIVAVEIQPGAADHIHQRWTTSSWSTWNGFTPGA